MYIQFHIYKGDYTHVTASTIPQYKEESADACEYQLKWDVETYYGIFDGDVWNIVGIDKIDDILLQRPLDMNCISSEISMKPAKAIVGELQLYSTYIFKTTTSTPVYLFRPIDYRLPSFYVHSNMKKKYDANVWISIDYTAWKSTDKFPSGSTKECYGSVNDFSATEVALFHHYQLYKKPFKIPTQETHTNKKVLHVPFKRPIISIDPDGCRDIDDAFSFEHDETTGITKLWIHISDVIHNTKWLNLSTGDSERPLALDTLIERLPRSTSTYLKKSIIPMLPNEWSSGNASLLQGETRYMLTLEIIYNTMTSEFQYDFIPTRGKITKNETYDSYTMSDVLQQSVSSIYTDTLSRYSSNDGSMREFRVIDTHTLIEAMMIIYNVHFGNKVKQSIIRTQCSPNATRGIYHPQNVADTQLMNYLRIIKMEKASYRWIPHHSSESTTHSTLGLARYTHASSPIRRMVDLLNQYIYYYRLESNEVAENLERQIETINQYEKLLRAFYRKLNVIYMANRASDPSNPLECDVFVVSVNIEKNRMTLYIPSENVSVRVPIVHSELLEITKVTMIDGHSICCQSSIDGTTKVIPMYRRIKTKFFGKPNLFAIDNSLKFVMEIVE
jgi:exoribonuclease R